MTNEAKAVAWYTDDHLTDKSATTWDPVVAKRWEAKGWPVDALYPATEVEWLEARVRDAADKLNAMELMAREAGFAEGIGSVAGNDLAALKAMFIRLADQLEEARESLTGATP